jgi:hypothetical protein
VTLFIPPSKPQRKPCFNRSCVNFHFADDVRSIKSRDMSLMATAITEQSTCISRHRCNNRNKIPAYLQPYACIQQPFSKCPYSFTCRQGLQKTKKTSKRKKVQIVHMLQYSHAIMCKTTLVLSVSRKAKSLSSRNLF